MPDQPLERPDRESRARSVDANASGRPIPHSTTLLSLNFKRPRGRRDRVDSTLAAPRASIRLAQVTPRGEYAQPIIDLCEGTPRGQDTRAPGQISPLSSTGLTGSTDTVVLL
jgi:hypothetical protein